MASEWTADAPPDRWAGIERPYSRDDVRLLSGSLKIEYTLANSGARKLWRLLQSEPYVPTLGAMSGLQAVQMVQAGLRAVYVSGWQVAADANTSGQTYPDQSLYPADSVPHLVRRLNNALRREDEKQTARGDAGIDWYVPLVADAEAGFGGVLNAFELTKQLIEAGAAGVHFEDQLSSVKKCGHLGGKVLVPVREFSQKLWAARLAADVSGIPMVLIARTDSLSANLLTSDIDPRDQEFLTGGRTSEGFFEFRGGIDAAIARGIACAPYADLLWFETSSPDLDEARAFAEAVHARHPKKLLAYNCSPSFNWRKQMSGSRLEKFQTDLGELGYKFQFVTLAGFHAMNHALFRLALGYASRGMAAYSALQEEEFEAELEGYRGVKHQAFVGTEYFDQVAQVLSGGMISTLAMKGSTERAQFAARSEAPRPAGEVRRRGSAKSKT